MVLNDFLGPQFKKWELDLYDRDGNYLISSYEKDRENDIEWKAFISLYKDVEVLEAEPAIARAFMTLVLDLKL